MARLNPACSQGHVSDAGASLLIFLSALVSSAWCGSCSFTHEEILLNYWLLCCMMSSERKHGRDWQAHFLLLVTCKNLLTLVAHAAHSVVYWPTDLDDDSLVFKPSWREERLMESHFSMIKSKYRGQPSLKEGWLGTWRCHLECLRQASGRKGKVLSQHDGISMTRATSLSLMALKSACKLLAATSVNLTPQQVYERLGAWWNDTGAKLLSGAQVGDASPEVPDAPEQDLQYDDAWGEDMEEVDLVKADEHGASDAVLEHDPNAAKLVRAEDDLTAWKEIEVLAKDLDADVAPPAVVEDGKDENLTDACTDTGVPTSLPEILDMVGGLPEWQFQSGTSHGEGACLRRVASLLKPIKDFATQLRINEKVLSPAQAQGMKPSDGNNQWNWVVHELAQAQQNSMQSATRISRSSGWFAATQSLCEAVA